ncbi:EamA family transporter [Gammaproteobacteria bacterium 42_54_T18]|nr:EamA family transporter [Gammaproteobacteria bacterium 42_54_T18]
MTITSPRFAFYLLLFVSFIWGAEFVLIDLTIAQLPTHTFNTLRFGLAALALLPVYYFSKERHQLKPMLALLGCGLLLGFLLFVGFYGQTEGMRYTSVSNAGFITGMNVPLVSLLGFILFKNRTRWTAWVGIITATLGLYLLTMGDEFTFNKGDLLVLICAFSFALHIIFTGRFVKNSPVLTLCIIQFFAVAAFSLLSALLSGEPLFYLVGQEALSWDQQVFKPIIIFSILIAGLLGTALAYWGQSACQKILAPHKVALIFASEPIFAHGAAWLFLDEHLGALGVVGAVFIILGMVISEWGDKAPKPKIEDSTAASLASQ